MLDWLGIGLGIGWCLFLLHPPSTYQLCRRWLVPPRKGINVAERTADFRWVANPAVDHHQRHWPTTRRYDVMARCIWLFGVLIPLGLWLSLWTNIHIWSHPAAQSFNRAWWPTIGIETTTCAVVASLVQLGLVWRYGHTDQVASGWLNIKRSAGERPGLPMVREARCTLWRIERVVNKFEGDIKEYLETIVHPLRQSVWEMAQAAAQSSLPEVIDDLTKRQAELVAVLREIGQLHQFLLVDLPAYEQTVQEQTMGPIVRLGLQRARDEISLAHMTIAALNHGIVHAKAAAVVVVDDIA